MVAVDEEDEIAIISRQAPAREYAGCQRYDGAEAMRWSANAAGSAISAPTIAAPSRLMAVAAFFQSVLSRVACRRACLLWQDDERRSAPGRIAADFSPGAKARRSTMRSPSPRFY